MNDGWFWTTLSAANPPAPTQNKPSPLKEPTEALMRASSWKDEAKSLFTSPDPKQPINSSGGGSSGGQGGLSRLGSGHLPKWVLESFAEPSPSGGKSIAAA